MLTTASENNDMLTESPWALVYLLDGLHVTLCLDVVDLIEVYCELAQRDKIAVASAWRWNI